MNVLLVLAALQLFQEESAKTVFIDRVAVKVNDKIITERELVSSYKRLRQVALKQYTGAELDEKLREAWQTSVADAEESLLLYEKAFELGIALSADDIRSQLMAVKESNGLSDEEFEEEIIRQTGMTLDEYADFRKREDSAQHVIQSQIIAKIKIEDSEIAKFFDEHIEDYRTPEAYRIAEILFLKNQSPNLARLKAVACLGYLEKDGDFAQAAQRFSDSTSRDNGGDLGLVEFGDLLKTIEDQARTMKVEEVSGILETANAFYVIKLLESNEPRPKPLEDVRVDILDRLRKPRLETRYQTYLNELKTQYLMQTYVKEIPNYLGL